MQSAGDTLRCWDPETGGEYRIPSNTWSCAANFRTCDCPPLKADPDIAGQGVTASLFISAIITALVSLVCILSASVHPRAWIVNRIDARVRPWLGELVGKKLDEQNAIKIAKVCYDMALCLGDQQLVTSIALLIAAIKKLHIDGSISVYHFTYVMNIAFLTSAAYMYTTITHWSMKDMDEPKDGDDDDGALDTKNPKPFLTWKRLRNGLPWTTRLLLMYTLHLLLLYSSRSAAREDWKVPQGCPALCVMKNSPFGGEGRKWMIVTHLWIISSNIAGMVENISFVTGRVWPRFLGQDAMDEEEYEAERAMGFGQIISVFFLITFVLQVFDSLKEHYKDISIEDRTGAMTPGASGSTYPIGSGTSLDNSHMSMNSLAPSIGPRARGTW
ncbi:hypothetical protein B0T13DRAFT_447273 [Neurospora crassa]|nr:hypothetical protein B0T13DRAFT_447273 [Neurospora crassa]